LSWPAAWTILDAGQPIFHQSKFSQAKLDHVKLDHIKKEPAAMILLYLLAAYAAAGVVTALAFVLIGVTQVQPLPVTLPARVLLLPGAFALWPLVLARWRQSRRLR
jgi:hypothetical protein